MIDSLLAITTETVYATLRTIETDFRVNHMVPFTLLVPRLKFLAAGAALALPWALGLMNIQNSAPPPANKSAIEKGLEAWRKVGYVNNASCASCHGPDGLEIAVYNFDDATIRRRAAIHVNAEDSAAIIGMIHALREKYGIAKPLDPMEDRPLQPGGAVLPGATPAERDAAFSLELEEKLPTLTHGRIQSVGDAIKAKEEMLKLDAWELKVGIQFNRLSEDIFHGKEHASIAQWLPDIPRDMTDEDRAAYFALQDAYLADPSDENFVKMLNGVDKYTHAPYKKAVAAFALHKFKSTLVLQHLERRRLLTSNNYHGPELFDPALGKMMSNPMWQFGDLARRYSDLSLDELGFPQDVVAKKSGGPSSEAQIKEAILPWLWLGWLSDQGMQRTGFDRQLQTAQYMSQALWDEGPYPVHNAFFNVKKLMTQSFVPSAWSAPTPQHYVVDFSGFTRNGKQNLLEPADPAARARYEKFVANSFRMCIYLLLDDLQRTHLSWGKDSNKGNVRTLSDFINRVDPESKPQTDALANQVIDIVDDCAQRIN